MMMKIYDYSVEINHNPNWPSYGLGSAKTNVTELNKILTTRC